MPFGPALSNRGQRHRVRLRATPPRGGFPVADHVADGPAQPVALGFARHGDLQALIERTAPYKLLRLTFSQAVDAADVARLGDVVESDGLKVTIRVPRADSTQIAASALTMLPVWDIAIEDPPVEQIISEV